MDVTPLWLNFVVTNGAIATCYCMYEKLLIRIYFQVIELNMYTSQLIIVRNDLNNKNYGLLKLKLWHVHKKKLSFWTLIKGNIWILNLLGIWH
jgi:hypothetical protein